MANGTFVAHCILMVPNLNVFILRGTYEVRYYLYNFIPGRRSEHFESDTKDFVA